LPNVATRLCKGAENTRHHLTLQRKKATELSRQFALLLALF
jgi:hypothetical protein